MPTNTKEKLMNRKGQFTSIAVQRRGKVTYYCGQIKKVTDKTITFKDMNTKEEVTTYLDNLIYND